MSRVDLIKQTKRYLIIASKTAMSKLSKVYTKISPHIKKWTRLFFKFVKKNKQLLIIGSVALPVAVIWGLLLYRWVTTPRPANLGNAKNNSSYYFQGSSNLYTIKIGDKNNNEPKVEFSLGKDKSVTFSPASARTGLAKPVEKNNTVTFKDVYPDTDYVYKTTPLGVKEDIVVKKANGINIYPFFLDLKGVTPKYFDSNIAGGVFYDEEGNYLFNFEKPFAVDAKGARTNNVNIVIKKDSVSGKLVAILGVDKEWLASPKRAYPITIDPTIVHDTTSEFATGQLNRVKDTGSGSAPILETYYQELTTDPYIVGLWHLNEASGNAVDSSGNGYTGTATNTTVVSGVMGNARSFTGASNSNIVTSANVPSSVLGANPKTMSLWFNTTDATARTRVLAGWGSVAGGTPQFVMYLNSAHKLEQSPGSGAYLITSPSTVNDGKWHHAALTYTGNTLSMYLDGILIGTQISGALTTDQTVFGIGGLASATSVNFIGSIDEVALFNRALTSEEVRLVASRRPYSIYTSDVIDLTYVSSWNSLSWTGTGFATGDGETATASATSNLIAQWNFNDTPSTATAVSGGTCGAACNGTLTSFADTTAYDIVAGSGWTSANKRWGAGSLMFDGTNDYVNVTDNNALDLSGDATWEGWFNFSKNNATQSLIQKDNANGYSMYLSSTGKLGLYIYPTAITGNSTISTGQWHHLVITKSGTTASFYIDGIFDGSGTVPSSIPTNSVNLGVGAKVTGPAEYLQGIVDSVRIYSRALTTSEILSNYNSSRLEFQTRVGVTADANDGTWEAWRPTTNETVVNAMDNVLDWATPSASIWSGALIATSSATVVKAEGNGSLKISSGITKIDTNTVGLWHLDETGGTGAYLKDSTANANDGTPTGTTLVEGISGKARSFNGTTDYVDMGSDSSINPAALTYSTWIKASAFSNAYNSVIAKSESAGRYATILIKSTGKLACYVTTSGGSVSYDGTGTYTLSVGVWYHLAFTYDSTSGLKCYVNGIQDGSAAANGTITTGADVVHIGDYPSIAGRFFSGIIDEVSISNIARTAEEIAETYRMGRDHRVSEIITSTDLSATTKLPFYVASDRLGTFMQMTYGESAFANYEPDANTVGLYHLDEQSGATAYIKDSSGNGNHGTPTGTTFTQGKIGKARYFDNSNDVVDLGSPSVFDFGNNGSFTHSGWINPTTLGDYDGFVSKVVAARNGTYSYMTVFMANGRLSAYTGATWVDVCPAGSVTTNKWQHVAFDYNGTTMSGYVNGKLCGSGAFTYTDTATHNIFVGSWYVTTQDYDFNGFIDEINISNIARSADEIRQAYEVGARTHNITIDFKAKLAVGDLITGTGDLGFTVDQTAYGATLAAGNLFLGDKIIVKENYDGTEYIAQGTVNAVNSSTGAVTVAAWDAGSTVPAGGFTVNATVFKWQREYFDLTGSLSTHRDAITRLTYRITDGSQGANVWLDDLRSNTGYLTNPYGDAIASSTGNRYFQYRAILSQNDLSAPSATLNSVTLDYASNNPPSAPTLSSNYLHDKLKTADTTPEIRFATTDPDSDDLVYQISWDTNSAFSGATAKTSDSDAGFANVTTPADTSPFTSGNTVSYTFQSALTNNVTYFYRVRAKDPSGANTYSSWSSIRSFTIDTALTNDQWFETMGDQFSTDTATGATITSNVTNDVRITASGSLDLMEYSSDANAQTAYVSNYVGMSATGGTIATASAYTIHTFTSTANFTPLSSGNVDVLVVAGGGGGADGHSTGIGGGGGGAGGMLYNSSFAVSTGSITATVGSGGSGWNNGNDSSFSTITATGGGRGSSWSGTVGNGGSGGGGSGNGSIGTGISGQGYNGGYGGGRIGVSYCTGGGGGGAGSVGSNGTGGETWADTGGAGGTGSSNSISGGSVTYSTGGTGGNASGGGTASSGAANTGNGGGGGNGGSGVGGSGGSGVIVVRYFTPPILQSFSESTIKTQGTYSLKGVAKATNSLNKTLTRTIASPLNLSGFDTATFDIRSTRTGSNIKVGLHDSGGTTTEVTPNITSANTFQTATIDLSGVTNANKDAIDSIIITVVNADADNTFYIDNFNYSSSSNTIMSTPITAANISSTAELWIAMQFNDEAATDIVYQVYYDVGGVPTIVPDSALAGNSTGFTTSPVDLRSLTTATYPILYLKATLSDSSGAPILYDWGLTLNSPPNTPTLDFPADTATNVLLDALLKTTTTDDDGDDIKYKIMLCTNLAMTEACQTFDQNADPTGWSATPYASGAQGIYTPASLFTPGLKYYWRSYAIDPTGSNTWSSTQSPPYSFTATPRPAIATNCRIEESPNDTSSNLVWTDNATNEEYYEVQRSVDGGAFSVLDTALAANTESNIDSDISDGHTYQYRVAGYFTTGPTYGLWCTTNTLTLELGTFSIKGLDLKGLILQ